MSSVNNCPNISMETIFINTENSQTSEPHKLAVAEIGFKKLE